jgi:2-amino-4-hydroxy-6-hydroxymethyldihydropteridine diphosphokinase
MQGRAFVLAPLVEIAPGIVIPGHGPAAACLARLAGQRVAKEAA